MKHLTRFGAPLLLGAAATLQQASAQNIAIILSNNDAIPGIGNLETINRFAIRDDGSFMVVLDCTGATTSDHIIMKGNALFVREGQTLPTPAGATATGFFSDSLAPNGDSAHSFSLGGVPTTTNVAVYRNLQLVVRKSDVALSSLWGPGTTYQSFSNVYYQSNGSLLMRGTAADPSTTAASDHFVSIFTLNAGGAAIGEAILARTGQVLSGQTLEVNTLASGQSNMAFSANGRAIFTADLSTSALTNDGVIYLWTGATHQLLAQEGAPSPGVGNWGPLTNPQVALNNAGGWLVQDTLAGVAATNEILVRNGTKLLQKGDLIPAVNLNCAGFALTPPVLTASGEAIYYTSVNAAAGSNECIFANQTLLARDGVTVVGGMILSDIIHGPANLAASPNGRFVMFRGTLGGVERLLVMDRNASIARFCSGDGSGTACPCGNNGAPGQGCASSVNPSGASLSWSGTASVLNDDLALLGSGMPSASCLYFQGSSQQSGGAGIAFGDGLRCAAGSVIRLDTKLNVAGASRYPEAGDPSIVVRGMIPAGGAVTRMYQCWYRNAAAFCTPSAFNLSNGVVVNWGL